MNEPIEVRKIITISESMLWSILTGVVSSLAPKIQLINGKLQCFTNTLPVALMIYLLLRYVLFGDLLAISDTLAWIHSTLEYEQKAKLLYIIEMGWLNLPEHDI